MTKPRLFLTRTLPPRAMQKLHELFDMKHNHEDRVLTKEEIIKGTAGCDALLCLLTDTIDKTVIDAISHVKVISNYAVGYNNIDVDYATAKKIPVCYTPGVLTETTADMTFALILSVARRIPESDRFTRENKFKGWGPELFLGADIYKKTLGLVGLGRIGQAVAKRAFGFDMEVLYTDIQKAKNTTQCHFVSFEELLRRSDFVSVHVPMSKENRHLFSSKQFAMMKRSAFLINTARGPIVDEDALVTALEQGVIAGAGLDVYEEEPKLHPRLTALANTTLLPHTASATEETRTHMGLLACENAYAVLTGKKPPACVNNSL